MIKVVKRFSEDDIPPLGMKVTIDPIVTSLVLSSTADYKHHYHNKDVSGTVVKDNRHNWIHHKKHIVNIQTESGEILLVPPVFLVSITYKKGRSKIDALAEKLIAEIPNRIKTINEQKRRL